MTDIIKTSVFDLKRTITSPDITPKGNIMLTPKLVFSTTVKEGFSFNQLFLELRASVRVGFPESTSRKVFCFKNSEPEFIV